MDELGRARRGAAAEVVLLEKDHLEAAQGSISSDPGARDSATDNDYVDH
jgi:hypothetical protein